MEKTEAAIERAHRALQVSPYDTVFAFIALTAAHFHAKRYAEAVDAATRAVESNPDFSISYAYLAAALVRAGRLEEARVTARRVLALDPTMSIRRWSAELGFMQAVFEPIADALHSAGIPEG
jgi:tetratricopeptide (TPR) repeat protein